MTVKLGDKARDTITGFTGTVTSRHEYLNGCVRVTLTPNVLTPDGKMLDTPAFDVDQLEVLESNQFQKLRASGGPESEPARMPVPSR